MFCDCCPSMSNVRWISEHNRHLCDDCLADFDDKRDDEYDDGLTDFHEHSMEN